MRIMSHFKKARNLTVLIGALTVTGGCATTGLNITENTNCEKHVELQVARTFENQPELAHPDKIKTLLASCEQEKRERVEESRTQFHYLPMSRGDMRTRL